MRRNNDHKRLLTGVLWILFGMISFIACLPTYADTATKDFFMTLNEEEKAWIQTHRGEVLKIGLDPFVGMDYFVIDGVAEGYLIDVTKLFETELDLDFELIDDYNWNEIFNKLRIGEIDFLFGANVTSDRLEYMSFSKPIQAYPYSIYTRKDSGIKTLSDIDGKRVGFLKGDSVIGLFPLVYKNVKFIRTEFDSQIDGFEAVRAGKADVYICANGGISKKFANDFPEMDIIADLTAFTSDMTLSSRHEDQVFVGIVNKLIAFKAEEIEAQVDKARKSYNRYILGLTKEEITWIDHQPEIIVGVADDYLPFDYYKDGSYKGIAGDFLNEVMGQVGISYRVVHGPFDQLYQEAEAGNIHIINMAKTDERERRFTFTKAISEERDEIFGDRKLPYLQDIYGLEGKRVAIVKGYWHKDYLLKNLSKVTLIETDNIQACIETVANGKAEYFIENPTVANYYIDGLGYANIIQKGTTSQDSFIYFGIDNEMSILASILNKSMRFVKYDKIKSIALQEVPVLKNIVNVKLKFWLAITGMLVIFLSVVSTYLVRTLVNNRTKRQILEERQKLIYLDGLTGLYNRLYFNLIEPEINESDGNQVFIMMDLNGLKQVNDNYGHNYGDRLLNRFAKCLDQVFLGDTIVRMGGDEFLVIMEEPDVKTLEMQIEKLDALCKEEFIVINEETAVYPTAAIGWSIRNKGQTVNEVIVEADQMMYQHKASLKRRRSDR